MQNDIYNQIFLFTKKLWVFFESIIDIEIDCNMSEPVQFTLNVFPELYILYISK